MRILTLVFTLSVTAALIYILDTKQVLPAPLGKLLSPQEGIWQNAEPTDMDFNEDLQVPNLEGKTEVYLDADLIPHVFAAHEQDGYFAQGFIHAKFRLWQMEFQTHATAGRLSEIIGSRALAYDKHQRRMGMVYGAENALIEMEKDPEIKAACDAYTAGVNAFINTLNRSELPLEYKLLGYQPEKWTNLKTSLFIKALTNDLAGFDRDFELTELYKAVGEEKFRMLFPEMADSLSPIIPKGTIFTQTETDLQIPATADSLYFHRTDSSWFTPEFKPDPANGSNNWALSGTRTRSGKPILCNDPHLTLSLPSIWFEMQLTTPNFNAYGVSFPGIPGIVIGFNDSIAFGFTNAGRDVRDYYEVQYKDASRSAYLFEGEWKPTTLHVESLRVKDSATVFDTVAYTMHGPVVYEHGTTRGLSEDKAYALRWVAHDPSNVLKMWYLLNRGKNYSDYLTAIKYFNVPGQNMLFASKSGDIALWQQASFPLRWKDQGLFVMPGNDSDYLWKGFIPQEENPHALNPVEGYIGSANQRPVDSTYPYFIPGNYEVYRGIILNRRLAGMQRATVDDMKALQNDNYNVFAEYARPVLLKYVLESQLDAKQKEYLGLVKNWNLYNNPDEKGATCFVNWWDSLQSVVFQDELALGAKQMIKPERAVLLEALLRDSTWLFVDDKGTPTKETLSQVVTLALQKASVELRKKEDEGKLAWGQFKNTTLYHLLRTNAMPFARAGLLNGGGVGILNASSHNHGPSWRMIVHLNTETEAYGIYPGGQSGNPGSKYYDAFVDDWTKGAYHKIWVMKNEEGADKRAKWKMVFKS